ncbi:hypothetical protein BH23BAC2_BH23BAC2_18520 [soil metagenome]
MSANYHNMKKQEKFTHESLIMSKIFSFLPRTTGSCLENANSNT